MTDAFAACCPAVPAETPHHPAPAINDPAIADLIGASISPNTRRAYRGALERLDDWLAGRELDDGSLASWISRLHGLGLSASTAALAVAAARFRAKMAGDGRKNDPAGPLTGRTLAGIRRSSHGRGRGQVAGITWEMADRVVAEAMREGTLKGLRDAALVAVASDALLRTSEMVAINAHDIDRDPDGSGLLHIRYSKTDQEGSGATCYLGPRTVAVLDAWMESAGIGKGLDGEVESVFRSVRKGGAIGGRLSNRSARAVITARCGFCAAGRVSGHSLRVGSAISLARAGASLVELQQAGRWKSPEMPARYTKGESARRGAVARLRHGQENGRRPAAGDPPISHCMSEANEGNGREERRESSGDSGGGPCAEPGSIDMTPGIRFSGTNPATPIHPWVPGQPAGGPAAGAPTEFDIDPDSQYLSGTRSDADSRMSGAEPEIQASRGVTESGVLTPLERIVRINERGGDEAPILFDEHDPVGPCRFGPGSAAGRLWRWR